MGISATNMLVQCATIRVEAVSTIKIDLIEQVIRSAISLWHVVDMIDLCKDKLDFVWLCR